MNAAVSIIGIFCIVAAAIEVTRSYCREIKKGLRYAKDAHRFVGFVRDSVSYHASPVNAILRSYETDEAELFEFYRYAADTSFGDALKDMKPPFDPKTSELLTEFASRLGRSYTDSQLTLCDELGEKLRAHVLYLEGTLKNKEKAAIATSIFISATAILLLI